MKKLSGKRVAILAAHGFEEIELVRAKVVLELIGRDLAPTRLLNMQSFTHAALAYGGFDAHPGTRAWI